MKRWSLLLISLAAPALAGCASAWTAKAANGLTFYVHGAGNIDFGDAGVREGLENAGYTGQVATLTWTAGFNPLIDQTVRINARLGAAALADNIEKYTRKYPGKQVNIVALSAGTGVTTWALENLKDGCQVDTVVYLNSSLWYKYDLTEALRHVRGKLYNYSSSRDAILAGPMKVFGTIDGKLAVDGAGERGFSSTYGGKVVNVPWKPEHERYGNYGGHGQTTNSRFVRAYVAPHILTPGTRQLPKTGVARQREEGLPPVQSD